MYNFKAEEKMKYKYKIKEVQKKPVIHLNCKYQFEYVILKINFLVLCTEMAKKH